MQPGAQQPPAFAFPGQRRGERREKLEKAPEARLGSLVFLDDFTKCVRHNFGELYLVVS